MILGDDERLQLQDMIDTNKSDDNTSIIRQLKQSVKIKTDVDKLIELKKKHSTLLATNKVEFENIALFQCSFLFNNYTDIYNKLLKDEINTDILYRFIDVLKDIEDEKINEHDGSVKVGEILKAIYIDSAMRKSKKLDDDNKTDDIKEEREVKNMSWADFKKQKI